MGIVKTGNGGRFLILSLLVVMLDQYTKHLVMEHIPQDTAGINVLPFFNLVYVRNEGAAFSFLAGMGGWQRWMFAAIAVVIAIALMALLFRTPLKRRWTCMGLALVIGGAIGNLIDRLVFGSVVDFLCFYISTDSFFWAYPSFNVADIAVCCGAALLIGIGLFSKPSDKNKKKEEKSK
ncbi:MAG: signal peptidase II [Succinatimonas hippei]|nr:signal peptidase II [Succinatimonas hippei]